MDYIPSSQAKDDYPCVSLYSLHQCKFNKSRLNPSRVKRETLWIITLGLQRCIDTCPPFFCLYPKIYPKRLISLKYRYVISLPNTPAPISQSVLSDYDFFWAWSEGKFHVLDRGETIHLPHDTIRIVIFHYDTVIFDTIHSCKIKLERKYFPPEKSKY
jgi:hypothetical protein